MSEWLNKIGSFISDTTVEIPHTKQMIHTSFKKDVKVTENASMSLEKDKPMTTHSEVEDENLKALKRLRELPRGTQVESRIAAIQNLLGEDEIFKTLKMLRWPQGVICPRCQSTKVIRKDPPKDSTDKRHHYECLNCKEDGSISDFDDFTDLPIHTIHALRQWILCWYLIGFCSVSQIAKVLGISLQQVAQIATWGSELAELPSGLTQTSSYSKSTNEAQKKRREVIDDQEERTRSASKSPFKPGYKSKK